MDRILTTLISHTMCFYDQYVFQCRDYKWGEFRAQCQKEYRRGETCGMKLVFAAIQQPKCCKLCEKVNTKINKRRKCEDNIRRWTRDGGRNKCSIEKAQEEIQVLDSEIKALERQRADKGKRL